MKTKSRIEKNATKNHSSAQPPKTTDNASGKPHLETVKIRIPSGVGQVSEVSVEKDIADAHASSLTVGPLRGISGDRFTATIEMNSRIPEIVAAYAAKHAAGSLSDALREVILNGITRTTREDALCEQLAGAENVTDELLFILETLRQSFWRLEKEGIATDELRDRVDCGMLLTTQRILGSLRDHLSAVRKLAA